MSQIIALNDLLKRYQDWMQAIREKDLETIADIYATDAVYMPPGRPAIKGGDAVRENWRNDLKRPDFVAVYAPEIRRSEALDMAYDMGYYKISMRKCGGSGHLRG